MQQTTDYFCGYILRKDNEMDRQKISSTSQLYEEDAFYNLQEEEEEEEEE